MRWVLPFLTLVVCPVAGYADEAAELNSAAVGLLTKYCHQCHGTDFKYPGLDILDRATLVSPRDGTEKPFLVPGNLEQSRIWQRVSATDPSDRMPPEDQPQPTEAERELLKRWLESGAAYPAAARRERPYRGEDAILEAIAADLQRVRPEHRPYIRYFTLVHLWNDPNSSDDDLRLMRAAVSKLLNSLSKAFRITAPRLVDEDGLVLAIDLRDYGWDKGNRWTILLAADLDANIAGYPYGLVRGSDEAQRVYELTQCDLPYVRADWFVYHASRPPLYHELLGLPAHQKSLEAELGVNSLENFDRDRVLRAAFRRSGVSDHARMVQRQDAKHGAYWDSFDSDADGGDADFFTKPLGPIIPGRRRGAAFKHAGGEVIFHLPNGLHGYYLATAEGERINEGPITIVRDPQQFSGSNAIVNGISCMGCHRQGYIPFEDTLRAGFERLKGQAVADKVLKIFPTAEEMALRLGEDRERYLLSLDKACLEFLRTGPDDNRRAGDFPEPITHVSKRYDRKPGFDEIARELLLPTDEQLAEQLGIPTKTDLKSQLKLNEFFQSLGLEPLSRGEVMARPVWESVFHRTARALKLGVPYSEGR